MVKTISLLAALLLCPAGLSADEGGSLSLKVYLPRLGVIDLGEISISIIPSPLMLRKSDQSGGTEIIPEEYKYNPQYARPVWEALIKRKWLALEITNPPTIELNLLEVPVLYPGYSYSAYVSPKPEDALTFGRLVGPNLRDVLFRYFTINVEASEIPKVETRRDVLTKLGRIKNRVKFRAKLVRVETSALNLFTPGTDIIDFLDFYLNDIEFLN